MRLACVTQTRGPRTHLRAVSLSNLVIETSHLLFKWSGRVGPMNVKYVHLEKED